MKLKFAFILIIFSVLAFIGCDSNEPEDNNKLELFIEDVSCTEAWLKISNAKGSFITLNRDEKEIMQFKLTGTDTIIVDDSLLPNKTYNYRLSRIQNLASSIVVPVTTMDTTSHNFTWQSWEFGESESSSLYDVAIIDENNIWAVGEIYIKDSLGNPDLQAYNAIHWDGEKWELKRIFFYTICGQTNRTSYAAKSIFAIDKNEIWIAMDGDQIAKLDNGMQTLTLCLPWSFSINKIWGLNSSDLYAFGSYGNIAHYQDGNWQKIESGTTSYISDIWGLNTSKGVIAYCTVSEFWEPGDRKILRIKNDKVDSISWNSNILLNSIYAPKENYLFACGWGVYKYINGTWEEIKLPPFTTNGIRGNGMNDIFVAGDYGFVAHFNGLSWKIFNDVYNAGYGEIKVNGNIVAIVGRENGKGIITIGRRN